MGWRAASDSAHLAGTGRYQAFSQEAGLIADDAADATRVPPDSRAPEDRLASPPHDDLHGDLPDGVDEPSWGRAGALRPEGSGQSRPRPGQRFPGEVAREGYGDAPVGGAEQDDEDTRQWEADDHRDWPGQERSSWRGQSTQWSAGNPGTRQGPDQRRLNGGSGGGVAISSGGNALAGRRSEARGAGANLANASARGTRTPQPPQPPPPPPPMGAAAFGEDALHHNGSAAGSRERFKEEEEEDEFGDGHAWGDVDAADEGASEAPLKRGSSTGHPTPSGGGRGGAREPWPRPAQQDSTARAGKTLQGAPPQSKLVQRVFGGLGRRGCLLYTSPSPRDRQKSRMPSSA